MADCFRGFVGGGGREAPELASEPQIEPRPGASHTRGRAQAEPWGTIPLEADGCISFFLGRRGCVGWRHPPAEDGRGRPRTAEGLTRTAVNTPPRPAEGRGRPRLEWSGGWRPPRAPRTVAATDTAAPPRPAGLASPTMNRVSMASESAGQSARTLSAPTRFITPPRPAPLGVGTSTGEMRRSRAQQRPAAPHWPHK